jgi:hypothetical protein
VKKLEDLIFDFCLVSHDCLMGDQPCVEAIRLHDKIDARMSADDPRRPALESLRVRIANKSEGDVT